MHHTASPTPCSNHREASLNVHCWGEVSDYRPIRHRLRVYPYGLGPTNPTRMFLASETLGLRRTRFSRVLSLLMPAFALRLLQRPSRVRLHRCRTLPYHWAIALGWPIPSFGGRLEPRELSARGHSTSELLRTLSRMAASKPTSWLFVPPHILCHLAFT